METTTLQWILGLPLAGALLLSFGRNALPKKALGWFGSLLVLGSFALTLLAYGDLSGAGALRQTLFAWGSGEFQLRFGLYADSIAFWWLFIVTGVGFLIHLYSIEYMAEEKSYGRYFAELNYFIFAMSLLVLADNFVGLLLGWANVGFASFLLIGFWNEKAQARAAARKALLLNIMGELAMVVALALIFAHFGSFAFDAVFAGAAGADPSIVTWIGLLLLVGIVTKSAQFPLHTWLPDAMQGPTPVSALIHAATMVTAGVYLVARAHPLFEASGTVMSAVAAVGAVSALFGALVAARQFDIKRVLAYSTMSQLGFMFIGVGVGAYSASLFHFFTHAFFKALLFLGAGIVSHYLHGEQDIRKMGGLGKKLPFAYWTFLIGVLAISGVPPFAGFFSKDEILAAAYSEGYALIWIVGLVSATLTAYYMMRLFAFVFAGKSAHSHEGHASGGLMKAPVAVLALLSVVGGLIGIPGVTSIPSDFLGSAFAVYGGADIHTAGFGWPALLVLILSLAGIAVAVKLFGPGGVQRGAALARQGRPILGVVHNAFYIDHLYMWAAGRVAEATRQGSAILHGGYLRRYTFTLFVGLAAFLFYFILI